MTETEVKKPGKIKARLKVRFRDLAAFIAEYRTNISKGGIFIRTPKPLAAGSRVEVQLILPETEDMIPIPGEVIHVVSEDRATETMPAGMGIDLKGMDQESKTRIEEFIRTRAAGNDMERREHKRYESKIRVRFGSLSALIEEYMQNISHGGIFIRAAEPKPLGEKLKIILQHPATREEMILEGEVVRVVSQQEAQRTAQPPGMGVRFTSLDKHTRDQLAAFINGPHVTRNKQIEIEES